MVSRAVKVAFVSEAASVENMISEDSYLGLSHPRNASEVRLLEHRIGEHPGVRAYRQCHVPQVRVVRGQPNARGVIVDPDQVEDQVGIQPSRVPRETCLMGECLRGAPDDPVDVYLRTLRV